MPLLNRRGAAVLLLVALGAACGQGSSSPPPSGRTPPAGTVVVLTLTPVAAGGTSPATLQVPSTAAQVQLRLVGDLPPPDALTAEVMSVVPDTARRWPVDAATPGADGARASVTLPAYALPPGDYAVTLWQGDVDAVQRYAFHVTP